MVKVCPDCGAKNFDEAKYCTQCYQSIRRVTIKLDPLTQEFENMRPRGYTYNVNEGNYYGGVAFVFAFLSFFFLPFIFFLLTVVFGIIAIVKGAQALGAMAIFVSGIFLAVNLVFVFMY
jgi:hypothetical protein